ncbi:MAG TPA: hypothetical protein VMV18_12975 [bacterium]|nr:hypothetical protein [bacterium]
MITRLLLTGFAPWDEFKVNSSALAVEPLDGIDIGGIRLQSKVLPVDWERAPAALFDAAEEFRPDAVVCFGMLSRGPNVWRVELVAHNHDGRPGRDLAPLDTRLPRILPTGLPAARILGRLMHFGLPAELSETAGDFLCNHVFFHAMKAAEEGRLPPVTGFVHVPPPQFAEDDPGVVANLDPLHEGARLVAEAVLSEAGELALLRPPTRE